MKWGEVKVGDVFVNRTGSEVDDVWVVLSVGPSEEGPIFVSIRYAYLHNIGEPDSISEWNAIAEQHAFEYDLIS